MIDNLIDDLEELDAEQDTCENRRFADAFDAYVREFETDVGEVFATARR